MKLGFRPKCRAGIRLHRPVAVRRLRAVRGRMSFGAIPGVINNEKYSFCRSAAGTLLSSVILGQVQWSSVMM
jgi:hypothetical protein